MDLVLGVLIEAEADLVERVPIGVGRWPDFELIIERAHDREPNREVVDVVFQVYELLAVGVVAGAGRQLAGDQDAVATVRLDDRYSGRCDGRAVCCPSTPTWQNGTSPPRNQLPGVPVERLVREQAEAAFRCGIKPLPCASHRCVKLLHT